MIFFLVMWSKRENINHPPAITISIGGMFTIPKWVVYDIVLTTLINIINYQRLKLYHIIPLIYVWVDYGFIIYGYIVINLIKPYLIGGFNPSEKYESQWER